MAYNYPTSFPQQNAVQQNFQQMPQSTFQQNVQPLFPQPQGNVYNINSTLEVANVPAGAGISVALCLNEGLMYIKSMQNGNPLFWAYRISPYDATKPEEQPKEEPKPAPISNDKIEAHEQKLLALESQIEELREILKNVKKGSEWNI